MKDPSPVSTKTPEKKKTARPDEGTQTVEAAIARVEGLYESLTGHTAPKPGERPYAPIPPEEDPMGYVERQLDRLTELLVSQPAMAPEAEPCWVPSTTTLAREKELLIWCDLPGVPRDQVDVKLVRGTLQIKGKRPTIDGERGVFGLQECSQGLFERRIQLPPDALCDELKASLRDGVLEVRIARVQRPSVARPVEVHAI